MIRLLDRYVVKQFMVPFVYCLVAFNILFIVGDLFEHLDDFLEIPNWPTVMVKYYLLFIPSTFNYIAAISVLLSLLYSLGALKKYNEISAMRSAGVLRRSTAGSRSWWSSAVLCTMVSPTFM